jgi:Cys-rich protein (TIGR01571 family)
MSTFADGQNFDAAEKAPILHDDVPTAVAVAPQAATPAVLATAVQAVPWQTGITTCGDDMKSCAEGLFCTYCQNARQFNMHKRGDNSIDAFACFLPFAVDAIFGMGVGSFFITWHNRREVRRRYLIEGSDCGDIAASFFCLPCSVCQVYREMSVRNEWPSGFCVSEPFAMPPAVMMN